MPRSLAQIESLAVTPFILLVAAIAGTVQAIPMFLHIGRLNLASARFVEVAAITGLAVLNWTGAAVLWWFAVRRRQYAIWLTALRVTVALAAADLFMDSLGYVAASIETRGEFAIALGRALPGLSRVRSASRYFGVRFGLLKPSYSSPLVGSCCTWTCSSSRHPSPRPG
ncbi:MAG TPA: hypothetical protein VN706_19705 [Gemmatimonadaceae bacterium]|nr:hypothetical protein [Gemmatimonadaceae bacterium]